jgi:hypothetical protein
MSIEATNHRDRDPRPVQSHQPDDRVFHQWISDVFDHPVGESTWYWNAETAEIKPELAVRHLTRLFLSCHSVLEHFSSPQIGQGLWYLVCGACSNYMWPLVQDGLPWISRRECIRAMARLFEQVFVTRCSDHLSHLDEPDADPLNEVCYMWWDLFPTWGSPDDLSCQARDSEALRVMSGLLSLDSVACQESALHGLGHWFPQYPEYVERSIREFLQREQSIRSELREYALKACRGSIL